MGDGGIRKRMGAGRNRNTNEELTAGTREERTRHVPRMWHWKEEEAQKSKLLGALGQTSRSTEWSGFIFGFLTW